MLFCLDNKKGKVGLFMSEYIVPISSENLEACIDLYIKVFNSTPWKESWDFPTAKERLSDLLHTPKFLGFLLYDNDTAIGFIAGNSKRTYSGTTFYLAELCINNQIQGKGYGSKLLQHLEKNLKEKEVQSIYLLTSNEGSARNFYLKNNYTINEDRIVMKRNLD